MKQRFTSENLVKYLYQESSVSERLAVREALQSDESLRDVFQELVSGYQQLPKVKFNASAKTLQRILRYSERTAVGKEA